MSRYRPSVPLFARDRVVRPIDLGLGDGLVLTYLCPGCGSTRLDADDLGSGGAFACPDCLVRWQREAGRLVRVGTTGPRTSRSTDRLIPRQRGALRAPG